MFFYYCLLAPCSLILKSVTRWQISYSRCQTFRWKNTFSLFPPTLKKDRHFYLVSAAGVLGPAQGNKMLWDAADWDSLGLGGREDIWEEKRDLPGWHFGSPFGSMEAGIIEGKSSLYPLPFSLKGNCVVFQDIWRAIVIGGQGSWALKVSHLSVVLVIFVLILEWKEWTSGKTFGRVACCIRYLLLHNELPQKLVA